MWRQGDYSGKSDWSLAVITSVLIRGKLRAIRHRRRDREEEKKKKRIRHRAEDRRGAVTSQGTPAATRGWKRERTTLPWSLQRKPALPTS